MSEMQTCLKAMVAEMLQERATLVDRLKALDYDLAEAKLALDAVQQKRDEEAAPPVVAPAVWPKRKLGPGLLTATAVVTFLRHAGPQEPAAILLHFGMTDRRSISAMVWHQKKGLVGKDAEGRWYVLPQSSEIASV